MVQKLVLTLVVQKLVLVHDYLLVSRILNLILALFLSITLPLGA